MLLNGGLLGLNVIPLSTEGDDMVYLQNVELLPNKIRIHYGVNGAGGLIDKKVVWRVR